MNNELLADWPKISVLLDQALALDAKARAQWLDSLGSEQAAWRAPLARLLQAEAAAQAADFLGNPAAFSGLAGSTADADAVSPAAQFQAGQLVGPWRLLSELGQGGMASVWLAQAAAGDFERQVALKLPHSRSPQFLERFRRERDILARLNHPGIARLFDAGVSEQGLPWLAMERVQGVDLLSWCAAQAGDVPARLGLVLQICTALQFAHARLVVHRDIKPSNVLVQADGQLRLLDFGIARLLDDDEAEQPQLTQLGARPMTPDYASPEQVLGEEPGVASDVYSLGVLLYQLLSGQSPYLLERPCSRHSLERAVLEQQPLPPSARLAATDKALRSALRGDLDTIVLKALAKLPRERYSSVEALADDLRRHLAGAPVLARRQSWGYVARRFVRRHRLGVALSAVAVAGLLGTTGWALASSKQARSEARRAEAMYGFVLGLFNPEHKPIPDTRDRDMPVSQFIERGSRQVLQQLENQPEARDRLMQDLGNLTQQLGLLDLSLELRSRRVEQAEQLHGARSVAYADALMGQRDGWEVRGQYKQGFEAAGKALAIYDAQGERDPQKLALAHIARGGYGARIHAATAQDVGHLQTAAALLEPLQGKNALGSVYEQLLVAELSQGHLDKAYAAALKGVVANSRQWGEQDWKTAASEDQAGAIAAWVMEPAEAERMLTHGLLVLRKAMGSDVVVLARGEAVLANLLFGGSAKDRQAALQHLQEAQRIVQRPENRALKAFTLTIEAHALELALRGQDWPGLRAGCLPYAARLEAPQPALRLRLIQACAASATHEGEHARAESLLTLGREVAGQAFAHLPARSAVLALREGELAWAQGRHEDARRLWRRCLADADSSSLPWRAQAWLLLASHDKLTPSEMSQLRDFRRQLEQAGGTRYYEEFLSQTQTALEIQGAKPQG